MVVRQVSESHVSEEKRKGITELPTIGFPHSGFSRIKIYIVLIDVVINDNKLNKDADKMEYIVYRCKICGGSFILLKSEEKHNKDKGNYLTCPFRGHKDIMVTGAYDSIKECMSHGSYKRDRGSLKQTR